MTKTPAQQLMETVAAAITEFKKAQDKEMNYYDVNLMLNTSWEILSEVPTMADESLEERIADIAAKLDDVTRETLQTAEDHDGDLLASRKTELS